ncbi:UNVERIFIED_CONTAM: hypothetical protein Slati_0933200 [Sesamum latifolium]|uniref:Uncharacterized protein n=1 Tax=Sesamum latifolium TaxID=2727402 RepID=A0AAW2XVZ2_9LAMI
MRSTWGCRLWGVDHVKCRLGIFGIGVGIELRDGTLNDYLKRGKGLIVKVVLQSLPTYAMSCFQLPVSLVRSLESMMTNFWWHNRGEKRVHWVAWSKLCRPAVEGRLGFRELREFNLALLSKQGWRIITRPESLLCKVMKARYFTTCSIGEAGVGSRPSLTWRGICATM